MTWPIDKLGLINQMLSITGNNPVAVAEDGSLEWEVGSAAYEHAFEYALDSHDWKQITRVVRLKPTGIPPLDTEFDTAYAKPADCIHVIWVRISFDDEGFGFPPGFPRHSNLPINYVIMNNQILIRRFRGFPGPFAGQVSPNPPFTFTEPPPPGTFPEPCVTVKYVSSAPPVALQGNPTPIAGDAQAQMLRTFMTALGRFVMAGIYRGINKDITESANCEKAAMMLLQQARTRSDQEQGKRAVFNQRITASRRVRRPWPVTPPGWGGTGTPG